MITLTKGAIVSGWFFCGLLTSSAVSGETSGPDLTADQLRAGVTVPASCGECQFGMEGESCDLAVRINGQAYFVVGTGIDDHGDAHAADGFCSAVLSARVTGSIIDDKFHATSFALVEKEQPGEVHDKGDPEESAPSR